MLFKYKYKYQDELNNFRAMKDNRLADSLKRYRSQMDYLRRVPLNAENIFVKKTINMAQSDWDAVEDDFIKALSSFYNNKELAAPDKVEAKLVRYTPYNYHFDYRSKSGWFASPLVASSARRNFYAMHELVHFYQPLPLPRPVKEAIPVILNDSTTFPTQMTHVGHKGDKEEQKWRKIIFENYMQGKNLGEILDKYYKQAV